MNFAFEMLFVLLVYPILSDIKFFLQLKHVNYDCTRKRTNPQARVSNKSSPHLLNPTRLSVALRNEYSIRI